MHVIPQKNKAVPDPLCNHLLRVNFSAASTLDEYRPSFIVILDYQNNNLANLVEQMSHSKSYFSSQ